MYCLFCVVLYIVCVYMCAELLPPSGYPIAVKYIISYIISCHVMSYIILYHIILYHIFEKYLNNKFHQNPSSMNRVVPCGQTDGRTDRQTYMTKLIVSLRNFANASNKI